MDKDLKYLKYLSELYPNVELTTQEIINLQSVMNLPKGTEHFISDLHGEYAAFSHVLRNGSGAVRKKIDDVFGHTLDNAEKRSLATLIYYPKEKIRIAKENEKDIDNWYYVTIYRLIQICKVVSSKYTRKRMRKCMPPAYEYIIEELITEKPEILNKESYYNSIVETIVEIEQAEEFIYVLCEMIQKLVIDRLHIIGDIFDRGPEPHKIMDTLMDYHSVDIQWGNHDVVWMGAAAGQPACIATVIRNACRYDVLDVLEDGYGINMLPLVTYALYTYPVEKCQQFTVSSAKNLSEENKQILMVTQKAIAVIQFKLEGQLIKKHPEYHMENRLLLDKINHEKGTIIVEGVEYPLTDTFLPSITRTDDVTLDDPYQLTKREQAIMDHLVRAFRNSEKLQKHVHFLLNRGSIYKIYNNNLLFHGCMPLNEDGTFRSVNVYGKEYAGKALYDVLENYIRKAFSAKNPKEREKSMDLCWWIWCSPDSPLFGKSKMATLEGYFVADRNLKKEKKDYYYKLLEKPKVADMIMEEFGCSGPLAHIISGHVPVHLKEGETPIRCGGKVLIIDGGFSKSYHKVTGIAGYTLIYNSYGMRLAAHEPFVTTERAIEEEKDIISHTETVYQTTNRALIKDTDQGRRTMERIQELKKLLNAYRSGLVTEK